MKNIRIDYYQYRLRKGRVDILLEPVSEQPGSYCIPFHYMLQEDSFGDYESLLRDHVYDDGDLVICRTQLDGGHLKRTDKEWIPLDKVRGLSLLRDEQLRISKNIFSFFLRLCPEEGESGNLRRAAEALEAIKIDQAKKKYVTWLENLLDWKGARCFPDAIISPPDPELIKDEIRTLQHFHLHRPPTILMNNRDGKLADKDEYDFDHPDLEVFGCTVSSTSKNW